MQAVLAPSICCLRIVCGVLETSIGQVETAVVQFGCPGVTLTTVCLYYITT
jgi:hypothetical protein